MKSGEFKICTKCINHNCIVRLGASSFVRNMGGDVAIQYWNVTVLRKYVWGHIQGRPFKRYTTIKSYCTVPLEKLALATVGELLEV